MDTTPVVEVEAGTSQPELAPVTLVSAEQFKGMLRLMTALFQKQQAPPSDSRKRKFSPSSSQMMQFSEKTPSRISGHCFECGEAGHRRKECPQRPRAPKQQPWHRAPTAPNPPIVGPRRTRRQRKVHPQKPPTTPVAPALQKPFKGTCFECGEIGHRIRECPSRQQQY